MCNFKDMYSVVNFDLDCSLALSPLATLSPVPTPYDSP